MKFLIGNDTLKERKNDTIHQFCTIRIEFDGASLTILCYLAHLSNGCSNSCNQVAPIGSGALSMASSHGAHSPRSTSVGRVRLHDLQNPDRRRAVASEGSSFAPASTSRVRTL